SEQREPFLSHRFPKCRRKQRALIEQSQDEHVEGKTEEKRTDDVRADDVGAERGFGSKRIDSCKFQKLHQEIAVSSEAIHYYQRNAGGTADNNEPVPLTRIQKESHIAAPTMKQLMIQKLHLQLTPFQQLA